MQGLHGSFLHSVKDPPPTKQSIFYSAFHRTYKPYNRLRRTYKQACAPWPNSRRTSHVVCNKAADLQHRMPKHPVVERSMIELRGGRLKRYEGHYSNAGVINTETFNGEIFTPSPGYPAKCGYVEIASSVDAIPNLSSEAASQVPFCLKIIARDHSKRFLYSSIVGSPRQASEAEKTAFKWLESLGHVYGGSLMVLVGLGYWVQGFRCFPWFAVNFYFKDVLTVDPGTLQLVQNTVNLPMVAKPVYGIVSDAVYIRGAHRVPYLVIGGFLQALTWGTIAFLPSGGASVSIIAVLLALSNLGASMVDVANDALVAECSKKKKSTGELQSFAWFSTAVGGVLGNLIGAFALSRVDFRTMFSMFGMLLLCQVGKSAGVNEGSFGLRMPHNIAGDSREQMDMVDELTILSKKRSVRLLPVCSKPSPYALTFEVGESELQHLNMDVMRTNNTTLKLEEEPATATGMWQQFVDLIHLVKQPEILYPLSWFMASYAMIPTLAGTMFFFQTQHLKIDPSVVGLAKVLGQVGLMGGSMVYSRYLKGMPMRKLLGSIQVLLCGCMMFDMLLVKRANVEWGIPDAVLVLGASAFVDAINQFKVLPFMVLLAQLCPVGSEGSLLAAFMSVQCLATIVSGYMGVTLASMLHISPNDFSELPTGIFVQSMAALLPLFWISAIPNRSKTSNFQQPRDSKET